MEPKKRAYVHVTSALKLEDTAAGILSLQYRGMLQERSANRPHENSTTTNTSLRKPTRSPSPIENVFTQRGARHATYSTANVHAPHLGLASHGQHIGLSGSGVERSEKQIRAELDRVYRMLQQSDKYQNYREKQPHLTPSEFIAREAREAAEKARRGDTHSEKDKSVWPEFLEHAFWRALVRWPPMSRKKYMHDGVLRGRNELIQDSIYKDTGIRRTRKQVSSHLQVLKAHLKDQPLVIVYMATKEDDKKGHRVIDAANAHQSANGYPRHNSLHTVSDSRHGLNASSLQFWGQVSALQSSHILGSSSNGGSMLSPYEVTDFTMLVDGDDQAEHHFTRLQSNGRVGDLIVTDTMSWHRQYPEFCFLRSQIDAWTQKGRNILVCDASIKIMREARPKANLFIAFNLHSQCDLSLYGPLECTTRFFDSGDNAPDPQFEGADAHDLKEHRTTCDFTPDPNGSSGHLRLPLGSQFWVNRMSKYQGIRHKDEHAVKRSLLRLTATQDVYGIEPDTGEAHCVLTVLWRFEQTKSSAEVGVLKWRAVTFGKCNTMLEQTWKKEELYPVSRLKSIQSGHDGAMDASTSVLINPLLYQPASALPLEYFDNAHTAQHIYAVQPQHSHHPPQLHLDILASLQPDLDHHHASAPTTAIDYSQHSVSLSHSQENLPIYAHDNDFDFSDDHITISGAFEPSIATSYDSFAAQNTGLDGLSALTGLHHDEFAGMGLAVGGNVELVPVDDHTGMACYSTKPNWHHHFNLISSLENAAEGFCSFLGQETAHAHHGGQAQVGEIHAQDVHEVLHGNGIYVPVSHGI